MKFTANLSLMYTERLFLQRFSAAKQDGFNGVEIQFPYESPIEDIKAELKANQQTCTLINVPAGDLMSGGEGLASVPGKTAEYAAATIECLSYARNLKVNCVNVLPGRCINDSKRAVYLDTFKKNLLKTAETFASFNILTTFEPINIYDMPDFLISTADEALAICDELQHPNIQMQFDIYHMSRMGVDVIDFIKNHGSKIGHIQFADVPGRGEPGSGELNFVDIFTAIKESDYSGCVGAEYIPTKVTSKTLDWLATA